jgi:hypothetical protein
MALRSDTARGAIYLFVLYLTTLRKDKFSNWILLLSPSQQPVTWLPIRKQSILLCDSRHWTDLSGQLIAPAALHAGKEPVRFG